MRVKVSSTIPADLREEVVRLVQRGFQGVNDSGVEVHVKGRRPRTSYFVDYLDGEREVRRGFPRLREAEAMADAYGTRVMRRVQHRHAWSGYAYHGVPSIANVARTTGVLVTLTIPADPRTDLRYPREESDPRLKTGPTYTLTCWQDKLVHIAAHEARHTWQWRNAKKGKQELDAERWAAKVLAGFQAEAAVEEPR